MTTVKSQSNAFDCTGPSVNGKHFRKASLATIADVKLHNATRSKTSSINTAAADKQKAALV